MYKKRNNKKSGRGRSGNRGNGRSFRSRGRTPSYNPMMFVRKADPGNDIEYAPSNKFSDFDLESKLQENISKRGYEEPTAIQDQAIPALLNGRDVVGIAATGTGKTAAFLIPLVNKVLRSRNEKVLIITPTRDLALQVEKELAKFTEKMNIFSAMIIGGENIKRQINQLNRNPNFVLGTPGRLMDLEKRRKINFASFENIVLDEVDRMLDMGFVKDITRIVSKLPNSKQALFFSATMPGNVNSVAQRFLNNPVKISIKTQSPSENVDQDIVRINGRNKVDILMELLNKRELEKVLVFGRTKRGVDNLGRILDKNGVDVATIHGNKSQAQRKRALDKFRNDNVQVLLATDVASRGLDINSITHVINYDVPETYDDYIHRIGRTGRAGSKGFALTFVD